MRPCRLCGFADPLACMMLERHQWIEWLLLLIVLHEAERVRLEQ